MGWVLPTGFVDSDSKWSNESNAYDNNTSTFAVSAEYGSGNWTHFLELTHSAILCNSVRFNLLQSSPHYIQIDIDVYYSGAWHDIYQGDFDGSTYVEKSLGGEYTLTALRIRVHNGTGVAQQLKIYEAHFYQVVAPTVTTQAVTDVSDVVTGNGNITATGGENATKRGFCWNTTGSPTVADSKVEENGDFGTGAFTGAITGLDADQIYYVKAYAYNSAGYGYGSQVTIKTPTVTTQAVSDILSTTATGNGNITATGNLNATIRGFQYKSRVDAKDITAATQENPCKITITGHGYDTGNTVIIFDVSGMTELNGKTYVITKVDDNNFTLDDTDATGYTAYTSGGKCDKWTGDTLNTEDTGDFGTGAYTKGLEDLSPGTTYYVRAYAKNAIGYGYGIWVYFTTDKVAPTVTTQDPTDVLPTTATANGNITASGGENATTRGFIYGLTKKDTWDTHDDGSFEAGAFTKGLTGLSANTTYWIRAYAQNSIGISYGDWVQFQTAASGTIPTGTDLFIAADLSGYSYQLMRSETDDGETYTAYFVISTDLTNKQGLAYYKRILDLHLYFMSESSGTATIYVKRDNEANWQTVGSVALTGTADIIVPHLAPDIRGKHFLFKISASNFFRFLGILFEYLPEDLR